MPANEEGTYQKYIDDSMCIQLKYIVEIGQLKDPIKISIARYAL
jgi:hypothetical protein